MIDIQASEAKHRFAIESVGITGLRYPMLAQDAATGEVQPVVADWKMGVGLPESSRGTHMSRFIAGLEARQGQPLDLTQFHTLAFTLAGELHASQADFTARFTWFRLVKAPVTGLAARLECQIGFGAKIGAASEKTLSLSVAAKALCPCSKAISDRGAHNQRSDISLTIRLAPEAPVPAINKLLSLLETSASSPVYPLLKREDEKFVTESAYDNPVFVEDIVRQAADKLVDLPNVLGFTVEAINRESIHAHDVYARITFPATKT